MKRIISSVLTLVIVLGFVFGIPVSAFAANTNNLTFELNPDGDSYSVTGYIDEVVGELHIPSQYNGLPVTKIAKNAFYDCDEITSVVIAQGIKELGYGAFSWCNNISSVVLPDGLEIIDGFVFGSVPKLTSIIIPDSVKSIGNEAFRGSGIAEINFPDNLSYIGKYAFGWCYMPSVVIPDSVKTIDQGAFFQCGEITHVSMGTGVETIGYDAFAGCLKLEAITVSTANEYFLSVDGVLFDKSKTEIIKYPSGKIASEYTIPEGISTVGYSSFENSDNLISINFPCSVVRIEENAFVRCDKLSNVNFVSGLEIIGESAFELCANLSSIVLPKTVTDVSRFAFSQCANLESITVEGNLKHIGAYAFGGTAYYDDKNNWEENKALYLKDCLIAVDRTATSGAFTVRENTRILADRAFDGCCDITSVKMYDGVEIIGANTLYYCLGLKWLYIPESVVSIGDFAFYGSDELTDIYYKGSEAQWSSISICEHTMPTIDVEIHYGCNCFHYDSEWITDKKASVYSAGSKHKECTECGEVLETEIIPQLKCAVPKISKAENTSSGVKVTWGKVTGADSYRIYRKESGDTYKKLADTTSTSYTDKTAKSGKRYYYVVKAENEAGFTEKSASKGVIFLARPKISAIANKSNGVKIAWGKVSGANEYKVYRKVSGGSYKYLGKTTSTSYTDKTAKSGKKYYYVVKTVDGSYVSEKSASKGITFVGTPTIKTPITAKAGVTVKWASVSGADGYVVYRKTGSGSYTKIATVKGGSKVSYLDKSAKKGKKYTYKVKAYKGSTYSDYSATKTITDKY